MKVEDEVQVVAAQLVAAAASEDDVLARIRALHQAMLALLQAAEVARLVRERAFREARKKGHSYGKIANACGISRQRVQQLAPKEGD